MRLNYTKLIIVAALFAAIGTTFRPGIPEIAIISVVLQGLLYAFGALNSGKKTVQT